MINDCVLYMIKDILNLFMIINYLVCKYVKNLMYAIIFNSYIMIFKYLFIYNRIKKFKR